LHAYAIALNGAAAAAENAGAEIQAQDYTAEEIYPRDFCLFYFLTFLN